jgi:hypothetical protein
MIKIKLGKNQAEKKNKNIKYIRKRNLNKKVGKSAYNP